MNFPDPPWLAEIADLKEREHARIKFYIRLAALYFTPHGDLARLSEGVGLHPNTLASTKRIPLSRQTALLIQHRLGQELFPQEMFLSSDAGQIAQ